MRIIDKEGNTVLHIEDAAALYAAVARGRKVLFNLLDAVPYAALDDYVKHRYGIDMEKGPTAQEAQEGAPGNRP